MRVDDRLLHGQVVFGWGARLRPRRYLIADDRVAADAWEREAYELAAPAGAQVAVLSIAAFASGWRDEAQCAETILLLGGIAELARLCDAGFSPEGGINLGGVHARPASRELLAYLHLLADEEATLQRLLAAGHALYAQDLPESRRHDAAALRALLAGNRDGGV